jgi:hypothetical protein
VFVLAFTLAFFLYRARVAFGPPSETTMEWAQSARRLATTRHFSTSVVYPLSTGKVIFNQDGTLPDLSHAPLPLILSAMTLRGLKQTGAGQGGEGVMLLGAVLWSASVAAAFALYRTVWGQRGQVLAVGMCLLSGAGVSLALEVPAFPLAALLMALLALALFHLDTKTSSSNDALQHPSLAWAILAGLLYGLLWLSLYSSFVLLPVLVWHLWRVARTGNRFSPLPLLCFTFASALVCAPFLLRTYRLTRNPWHHSRLAEVSMHTKTYPGFSLYRMANPPQTLGQYLASGGTGEIASKTVAQAGGLCSTVPVTIGVFAFALFLGASLTRFTKAKTNRWRNTLYIVFALHLFATTPFLTADEAARIAVVYAPVVAVVGAAFLLAVVEARRLPWFYARAAIGGWAALSALTGIGGVFQNRELSPRYTLYDSLNEQGADQKALRQRGLLVITDTPVQTAYWCDVPALWLPSDGAAITTVQERAGKAVGAVAITPGLRILYAKQPDAQSWLTTYDRIHSIAQVASVLNQKNGQLAGRVVQNIQLFYPAPLNNLSGFRPIPVRESKSDEFSLLLWNNQALQ